MCGALCGAKIISVRCLGGACGQHQSIWWFPARRPPHTTHSHTIDNHFAGGQIVASYKYNLIHHTENPRVKTVFFFHVPELLLARSEGSKIQRNGRNRTEQHKQTDCRTDSPDAQTDKGINSANKQHNTDEPPKGKPPKGKKRTNNARHPRSATTKNQSPTTGVDRIKIVPPGWKRPLRRWKWPSRTNFAPAVFRQRVAGARMNCIRRTRTR